MATPSFSSLQCAFDVNRDKGSDVRAPPSPLIVLSYNVLPPLST